MFYKVTYRRGVIEGAILYALGRIGALFNPAIFPDWLFVAIPLLFLALQLFLAPFWATGRIASPKRERLSKRFWLLGPLLAIICSAIDLIISLTCGLPVDQLGGVQKGAALTRLMSSGPDTLSLLDFAAYEFRTLVTLLALHTLIVICMRLARGGFLRFTMPTGGNRVTL